MRKVGDLMRDMGFNPDAPLETQKAFIRHLVRAANEVSPRNNTLPRKQKETNEAKPGDQLSFDLDVLGVLPTESRPKKSGT